MKVRVLKAVDGTVTLQVISEGLPVLPPVVVTGLPTRDVGKRCLKVLKEVSHAQSRAILKSPR